MVCMDLRVYDYAAGQMSISVYIFSSEYHCLWTRQPKKRIYTAITEWGVLTSTRRWSDSDFSFTVWNIACLKHYRGPWDYLTSDYLVYVWNSVCVKQWSEYVWNIVNAWRKEKAKNARGACIDLNRCFTEVAPQPRHPSKKRTQRGESGDPV